MNKKITGLAYAAAVSPMVAILNKGNSINGSKATIGIGRASVTHRDIISTAKAITMLASDFKANGFIKKIITATATQVRAISCLVKRNRKRII